MVLTNNNHVDQWNRIENAGIEWYKYSQMIFDRGTKAIQWTKNNLSNKYCWNNWTAIYKKMDVDTDVTLLTNIKCKAVTLIDDNIWKNLHDFEFGAEVLDKMPN